MTLPCSLPYIRISYHYSRNWKKLNWIWRVSGSTWRVRIIALKKKSALRMRRPETKKAKASEHMADLTVYNNAPHDNYRASASTQFRNRTNEAAKLQEQIHKSRVGQQLKLELRKIWLARQEVRQARMSLELIKINVRVGEVTCPVKCKVIRVYAIPELVRHEG